MTDIFIDTSHFPQAEKLCEIISFRMLKTQLSEGLSDDAAGSTLVFSAKQEEKLGGEHALISFARSLKPKLVFVINFDAKRFCINPSLGGKMIHISIPTNDRFALTVASDMICADLSKMIAVDPATSNLLKLASRVAQSNVTAFVNGPTGTGKEVLSRFVHDMSNRKAAPFVAINCAAIPENMLEAVLFGHEKGAFTGASVANKGIFRAADHGTLLLDEISEMPIGLQSKLLRVLQERKVTPLGAQTEIQVDVRVLATSNRDMRLEVQEKRFREDLFYRLNVFPIVTEPLNARPLDILPIAVALLRKHASSIDAIPWLSSSAQDILLSHDWPGNVRELENVMQRALVLQSGGVIEVEDVIIDVAPMNRLMASQPAQHAILSRLSN